MGLVRFFSSLLLASLVLTGCDSDEIDGQWNDNIKLSQRTVEFSQKRDSILITTEGEGWWIAGISFEGASDYQHGSIGHEEFLLEEEHFELERRSPTTLYIEFQANQTSNPQILFVQLQNGNYFDGVKVTQQPKQP